MMGMFCPCHAPWVQPGQIDPVCISCNLVNASVSQASSNLPKATHNGLGIQTPEQMETQKGRWPRLLGKPGLVTPTGNKGSKDAC